MFIPMWLLAIGAVILWGFLASASDTPSETDEQRWIRQRREDAAYTAAGVTPPHLANRH